MRQISRTAFLAAGIALIAVPGFAQGGAPAATGTAPVQAARPATPPSPAGGVTGSAQRPASTTPNAASTTAPHAANTPAPRAATTPAPHAATTPAPHAATAPTTPRTDQRSQAAPATPAPVRTN